MQTLYGDKDRHDRIAQEKVSERKRTMLQAFLTATLAFGAATIAGMERASVSQRHKACATSAQKSELVREN